MTFSSPRPRREQIDISFMIELSAFDSVPTTDDDDALDKEHLVDLKLTR